MSHNRNYVTEWKGGIRIDTEMPVQRRVYEIVNFQTLALKDAVLSFLGCYDYCSEPRRLSESDWDAYHDAVQQMRHALEGLERG